MNDQLKEFLQKIHKPKKDSKIPVYATIIVRPGKKIIDFKIKKMESNMLKVIAHEEKIKGWHLHSFHIPIRNLGLSPETKNKEILTYFSEPKKITSDRATRELVDDILRKYVEILPEKKTHYFKTARFKKKKEYQMGVKMKGF